LRQRRHALPEPASYSDRMAIARFHQLSATVRGDAADVRIAKAFLAMAAKACENPESARLQPEMLCGELRGNRTRELDPNAYWVRLRRDDRRDAGPPLRYAMTGPAAAPVSGVVKLGKDDASDADAWHAANPPVPVAVLKTDLPKASGVDADAVVATKPDVGMTESGRSDPKRLPVLRSVPVPVSDAAPSAPPAAPPADPWPARLANRCAGPDKQLFVHIHEESTRAPLSGLPWDAIAVTFRMQGIENVTITSAAQGRDTPAPHPMPTLIVHDLDRDGDCAAALTEWIAGQWPVRGAPLEFRIRSLPRGYSGRPGVIELWWPPQDAQAGSGE
jgi:hypothetical protein